MFSERRKKTKVTFEVRKIGSIKSKMVKLRTHKKNLTIGLNDEYLVFEYRLDLRKEIPCTVGIIKLLVA